MSHHHHHHSHKKRSSSSEQPNSLLGGFDLSSIFKDVNLPSLAQGLIGNMDIGRVLGVLSSLTTSPLQNTVKPQTYAAPINKDIGFGTAVPVTNENTPAQEAEQETDDTAEAEAETEAEVHAETPPFTPTPEAALKIDPEKFSNMLNNIVNMLGTTQK